MAAKTDKKVKPSINKVERVAHWAFMDHIRKGLTRAGVLKPEEKLIIKDAVDGFFGEGEPTGHLLATDAGCFGNNFGLCRIIAYVPWFDYREGYTVKVFADSEYWQDVLAQLPAAMDTVTNLYGIKFDHHCIKNLFEARLVDNPVMQDFLSRDDDKSGFWTSAANKLWKRPKDLYVGVRFAIVYTQGFRMRHKDTPEQELQLAKEECRTLLKQLAGWKGMRHLIEEQGLKLIKLIESELQESVKANREAAAKIEQLERKANDLVDDTLKIYKKAFERSKKRNSQADAVRAAAIRKEDMYDFTPTEMSQMKDIDTKIEKIRNDIIPYVHEKGLTEGKIADLTCKSAITRYAVDFFID